MPKATAAENSLPGDPGQPAAPPGRRRRDPLANLPRGPLSRQVLVLALPMLGEQVVNFLVGLTDVYLAGQISKEATAAVGAAAYFAWLTMTFFSLVGTGATAVVARSLGAGDNKLARRSANQAIVMAFGVGAVAGTIALLAASSLADLLTDTPEAYRIAATYLRIEAIGFPLTAVAYVSFAVLRASGDTRTPMIVMVLLNIVNIVVSVALVYGIVLPEIGVNGIAIGTVTARSLTGVLVLVILFRVRRPIQLRRLFLFPQWPIMWRMLRIGLPASADAALMGLTHLLFITIVSNTGDEEQSTVNFAAHVIGIRMEGLGYLPAFAWAIAGSTLVGQYLGAKKVHEATRAGHIAAFHVAIVTACIGSLFFFFAEPIYRLMTPEEAVIAVGAPAFRFMGLVQPVLGLAILYTVILRNVGDTRTTMTFTLLCGLLLRVPLAYLFGVYLGWGLIGAWCGMWADNIAKFFLAGGRYLHGGWKRLNV
jgi:putative MATE family efflux protein